MASDVATGEKSVLFKSEVQINDTARRLLEVYSSIPAWQVLPHVQDVRAKAYEIFPYPCVAQLAFTEPNILSLPWYEEIVYRLRTGEAKLLDIGCGLGQNMRQLAFDGVPSERLYGAELYAEYVDLGYTLFRDRDTLKSKFIVSDILDPDDAPLQSLYGTFDIVQAGQFFHCFGWQDSLKVCERIVQLLKPEPGSIILGELVGSQKPQEMEMAPLSSSGKLYLHDLTSFRRLWDAVGEKTGTRWQVDGEVDAPEIVQAIRKVAPDTHRLIFRVTRR